MQLIAQQWTHMPEDSALDPRRPGEEITPPGLWIINFKLSCYVNNDAEDERLSHVVLHVILHSNN